MYSNITEHYHFPQYAGSDVPSVLDDLNESYEKLDDILYEHGEGMASIMADNALIHNELTEIRQENNTIQLEILNILAKDREQDDRLNGIDKALDAIANTGEAVDPETGKLPDEINPTSSGFNPEKYKIYIESTNIMKTTNLMYPVGMILAFANTTNPNNLFRSSSEYVDFASTWVALDEGRVLVQGNTSNVGNNNSVDTNAKSASSIVGINIGTLTSAFSGTTDGHQLAVNELPAHTHTVSQAEGSITANNYDHIMIELDKDTPIVDKQIATGSSGAYAPTYEYSSGNRPNWSRLMMSTIASHMHLNNAAVNVSGGGNGSTVGNNHTHGFSGSVSFDVGTLSSTVTMNYNTESPATYVRYWKRTA